MLADEDHHLIKSIAHEEEQQFKKPTIDTA
jgi:hypothetical protein